MKLAPSRKFFWHKNWHESFLQNKLSSWLKMIMRNCGKNRVNTEGGFLVYVFFLLFFRNLVNISPQKRQSRRISRILIHSKRFSRECVLIKKNVSGV
jgi:hypothetical protein